MPQIAITNKFNLPETLVKAVAYDTHRTNGTISVTTLIDGPQIRVLKAKYDYTVDVMDGLYALLGTALHHILERSDVDYMKKQAFLMVSETLIEKSLEYAQSSPESAPQLASAGKWLASIIPVLFPEINDRYIFERTLQLELPGGGILSGTFDLYDKHKKILYDYKYCSVFSFMNPESKQKWVEQTNIYAYMLMMAGFEVKEIRIVAFFRDWSRHGIMKDRGYPPSQIQEIVIAVRPPEKTLALIYEHNELHMAADRGENVQCDGKIRWAKADVYAVMASGRKNSVINMDNEAEALKYIDNNAYRYKDLYLQVRPGGSMRCENYCVVSKFCRQRAAELQRINDLKGK
jgi:hypothetical protein